MGSANFYTEVISRNTNEIEFVKTIKEFILGLDDRITCTDDPDYEYDRTERGDSYVPKFNFYINSKLVFIMQRANSLSNGINGFTFYVKRNDESLDNCFIQFGNMSVQAYTVVTTRSFYISYIVSDDLILLDVHQNFSSWGSQPGIEAIYAKSGSSDYIACQKITSVDNYTKVKIFDISNPQFNGLSANIAGTFTSRFGYAAKPGQIDYVKSAAYTNAGTKVFDINAICDCTTVTVGDTVSLKDGSYLAVGLHQLVKVS